MLVLLLLAVVVAVAGDRVAAQACPPPLPEASFNISTAFQHSISLFAFTTTTTITEELCSGGESLPAPLTARVFRFVSIQSGTYAIKLNRPPGDTANDFKLELLELHYSGGQCISSTSAGCQSSSSNSSSSSPGWDAIALNAHQPYALLITMQNGAALTGANVISLGPACPTTTNAFVIPSTMAAQSAVIPFTASYVRGHPSCGPYRQTAISSSDMSSTVDMVLASFTPPETGVYEFRALARDAAKDSMELRRGTCSAVPIAPGKYSAHDAMFCSTNTGDLRMGGQALLTAGQEYTLMVASGDRTHHVKLSVRYVGPEMDDCPNIAQHQLVTPSSSSSANYTLPGEPSINTTLKCDFSSAVAEMRYVGYTPPTSGYYTLNVDTGAVYSSAIEVRHGTCTGEALTCNSIMGRASDDNYKLRILYVYLAAGQPYVILVGQFRSDVTAQSRAMPVVLHVEPAPNIVIGGGGVSLGELPSVSSACANHNRTLGVPQHSTIEFSQFDERRIMTPISCSATPGMSREAVYVAFTPAKTATYYVHAVSGGNELALEIRRGSCALDNGGSFALVCNNVRDPRFTSLAGYEHILLLKNETYYILVSLFEGQRLPFMSIMIRAGIETGAGGEHGTCIDNPIMDTGGTTSTTEETTLTALALVREIPMCYPEDTLSRTASMMRYASYRPLVTGAYSVVLGWPTTPSSLINDTHTDMVFEVRDTTCQVYGGSGGFVACQDSLTVTELGFSSIVLMAGQTYVFLLGKRGSTEDELPFGDVTIRVKLVLAHTLRPTVKATLVPTIKSTVQRTAMPTGSRGSGSDSKDPDYGLSALGVPQSQAIVMLAVPLGAIGLAVLWAACTLMRRRGNSNNTNPLHANELVMGTLPASPCTHCCFMSRTASLARIRYLVTISRVLLVVILATNWVVFWATFGYFVAALSFYMTVRTNRVMHNFQSASARRAASRWSMQFTFLSGTIFFIGFITLVYMLSVELVSYVKPTFRGMASKPNILSLVYGVVSAVAWFALGVFMLELGRVTRHMIDLLAGGG